MYGYRYFLSHCSAQTSKRVSYIVNLQLQLLANVFINKKVEKILKKNVLKHVFDLKIKKLKMFFALYG